MKLWISELMSPNGSEFPRGLFGASTRQRCLDVVLFGPNRSFRQPTASERRCFAFRQVLARSSRRPKQIMVDDGNERRGGMKSGRFVATRVPRRNETQPLRSRMACSKLQNCPEQTGGGRNRSPPVQLKPIPLFICIDCKQPQNQANCCRPV